MMDASSLLLRRSCEGSGDLHGWGTLQAQGSDHGSPYPATFAAFTLRRRAIMLEAISGHSEVLVRSISSLLTAGMGFFDYPNFNPR
jgi:hypothetical protein